MDYLVWFKVEVEVKVEVEDVFFISSSNSMRTDGV